MTDGPGNPLPRDGEGAPAPEGSVDPDVSEVDDWVEEGDPPGPTDLDGAEGTTDEQPVDAGADARPDVGPEAGVAELRTQLVERTADLQRLQAEFLNYKRRVERDRELISQNATYRVLVPIIDVLDTVDRAREHGDLDEGFRAVAEQLERVVSGLGLSKFGAPGDAFDPNLHEALSHVGEDPDVKVTTCRAVVKAGYRIGERVVRAAQVLVVDPAAD